MDHRAAARAFTALGNERRVEILDILKSREHGAHVTELSILTNIPLSSLSFHLTQLRLSGLLTAERMGSKMIYSIDQDQLEEAASVLLSKIRSDYSKKPLSRIQSVSRVARKSRSY